LKIVRKAMYQVVYGNRGTGRRVQIDGIAIAAKTGTAQVPNRDDDAWFVAFAPYENPAIAVAAVIEGGGGGGAVAGPIVRQVIEAYFKQSGTADPAATDTLLTAH
jgi:cell division protein FtsI/penicillin-binding protein 2